MPILTIHIAQGPPNSANSKRLLWGFQTSSRDDGDSTRLTFLRANTFLHRTNAKSSKFTLYVEYYLYFVVRRFTFAQLHRHGARYPNEEDDYPTAVKHLLGAKEISDPSLDFLKDYEYDLPEEMLTPFGAEQ